MTLQTVHRVGRILIDTLAVESKPIAQLQSLREQPNLQSFRHKHGGSLDPTFAGIRQGEPSIAFESTGIHLLLDTIGLSQLKIDSDGSNPGFRAWLQEDVDGGTRALTGEQLTIGKGIAVLGSIRASQDEDVAGVDGVCTGVSPDDTTDPIVRAADQTVDTTAFVEREFGMGKVVLNGTDLDDQLAWSLELGNGIQPRKSDNSIYPTFVSLTSRNRRVTLDLADAKAFRAAFGVSGRMTDLVFYLRHLDLGGSYVLDATLTHIKFTAVEGTYQLVDHSAGQDSDARAQVMIDIINDGTNDLTVDTTSAIT